MTSKNIWIRDTPASIFETRDQRHGWWNPAAEFDFSGSATELALILIRTSGEGEFEIIP